MGKPYEAPKHQPAAQGALLPIYSPREWKTNARNDKPTNTTPKK